MRVPIDKRQNRHHRKAHRESGKLKQSSSLVAFLLMPSRLLSRHHLAQRHIQQRTAGERLQYLHRFRVCDTFKVKQNDAQHNAEYTSERKHEYREEMVAHTRAMTRCQLDAKAESHNEFVRDHSCKEYHDVFRCILHTDRETFENRVHKQCCQHSNNSSNRVTTTFLMCRMTDSLVNYLMLNFPFSLLGAARLDAIRDVSVARRARRFARLFALLRDDRARLVGCDGRPMMLDHFAAEEV